MKKAVIPALGLILIIASAATVRAASQIDFSGYADNWRPSESNPFVRKSESFADVHRRHHLEISLIFPLTDKKSVCWRIRVNGYARFGHFACSDDYHGRADAFDRPSYNYVWDNQHFGLAPTSAANWVVTTRWPWPSLNSEPPRQPVELL